MSKKRIYTDVRQYAVPMLASDMDELKIRTGESTAKGALCAAVARILEAKL
jgi:hypothetical protein